MKTIQTRLTRAGVILILPFVALIGMALYWISSIVGALMGDE